jgi:hypothetical protein
LAGHLLGQLPAEDDDGPQVAHRRREPDLADERGPTLGRLDRRSTHDPEADAHRRHGDHRPDEPDGTEAEGPQGEVAEGARR